MSVLAIVLVSCAAGLVLFNLIYTVTQGIARRARERAAAILARDGITAVEATSVNLIGSSTMRVQVRGVGVLALTSSTLEFRLGYGATALTIPLSTIQAVTVGKAFRIRGRYKRYARPWIVTVVWLDADGAEQQVGFALRAAAAWHAKIEAAIP